MTVPIKFVCNQCGQDNSVHALAYVGWNIETQDWEFEELYDDDVLRCTCGHSNAFREEPVTDLKVVAQHAIKQAANAP
jgi:DNA-directed RNA polymerase subunit RPC12/RpoP